MKYESELISLTFFRRAVALSGISIVLLLILIVFGQKDLSPLKTSIPSESPCFKMAIPPPDSPFERETLRLLVDAQGRVKEVSIMQSSGHRALDEAAMQAAVKNLFKPGLENNTPVPCYVSVPYRFALEEKERKG